MKMPTTPRRRWYQFSLASLLLFIALIAVSAFAVREHWERRRLEQIIAKQPQIEFSMGEPYMAPKSP
jgi:hypothetical protein